MKRRNAELSSEEQPYLVPALYRGLKLLEHFSVHREGCRLSDLQATGLAPATLYRMLCTLEHMGYLLRSEGDVYHLSHKLVQVGYQGCGDASLIEVSMAHLRHARNACGETVLLGILNGAEGIVLAEAESTHAVKVTVRIGHHFPLHSAAPGKALLAFLPEDELAPILAGLDYQPFNSRTLRTEQALRRELEEVRETGLAYDHGEELADLRCVGAPILDATGYPVAAVWASGPVSRLDDERLVDVSDVIRHCAQAIALNL